MKNVVCPILENRALTATVWRMRLGVQADLKPGQFLNIALAGKYLRRPISVCDWDAESVTILYKVVGRGTEQMSHMAPGECLDVLLPLGNGFDPDRAGDAPLLIGGGVGCPPIFGLAKTLVARGIKPRIILGFNTASEVILADDFRNLGLKVTVTTADGSAGIKGFVTDVEDLSCSYYYTCGPEPMLRAVYNKIDAPGELSFEERMGCGFGACMGCSCKTKYGNKRICKDGPVLEKEEIVW